MQTKHTVLGLAVGLTALERAKKANAPFRDVLTWEEYCKVMAQRARDRILKFAIDSLAADGRGIGASFVRNVVRPTLID